jgi:hypothetical protein
MKFLTTTECVDYAKGTGPKKDILDRRKLCNMKKSIDFFYRSPLANGRYVATEIVSYLGKFASTLLWTHGLIWGDRTKDPDAPDHWVDYDGGEQSSVRRLGFSSFPGNCSILPSETSWQRESSGRLIRDRTPSFSRGRLGS